MCPEFGGKATGYPRYCDLAAYSLSSADTAKNYFAHIDPLLGAKEVSVLIFIVMKSTGCVSTIERQSRYSH
jgi:hypothetical protein